jgi:hypothetical protein
MIRFYFSGVSMNSKGSSSAYLLSRAVEEPLEATFELGENIQEISHSMAKPVALGILGHIAFIILLIPGIINILSILSSGLTGSSELTSELLLQSLVLVLIIIFLLSITATSIIYLGQVYKFNKYLLQRYSLVNGLTKVDIREATSPERGIDESQMKGERRHLKNPIFAMLDLVEESMHELPQIGKLIRFSTYFIVITVIFLILTAVVKLTLVVNLIFVLGLWELVLGVVVVVLSIPTIKLLLDSEYIFKYVQIRHNIIDGVRFHEDISVPAGDNQMRRLIRYLLDNDPYIKSSAMADDEVFRENVTVTGQSGKGHKFDGYFTGVNILKEKSVSLGIPMGRYTVFIKVFNGDVTLHDLKALREAVTDISKKENAFPLRVMALQSKVTEIEDEVYDFVLENPILWMRSQTHIQIAVEDGKIYSFIPMISYGRGVD